MNFDLRIPIGLMFSIYGVILAVNGLLSKEGDYARALGININLIWGIVLLLFGAFMLVMAWRGKEKAESSPTTTENKKSPNTAVK